MPLGRRRIGRPGLIGTMARTAAITGTATAVHGGMSRRQAGRDQAAYDEQAAQQAAYQSQAQVAEMQAELDAMKSQQAAPAPPAASGGGDVLAKLQQLADLKAQGILDDSEFAAAKAKLLAE